MRVPRLTAGYAIGPALGQYRAPAPGGRDVLVPMACQDDEIECPPGSNNCCTVNQECRYDPAIDRWYCQDLPPAPPPSPEYSGVIGA